MFHYGSLLTLRSSSVLLLSPWRLPRLCSCLRSLPRLYACFGCRWRLAFASPVNVHVNVKVRVPVWFFRSRLMVPLVRSVARVLVFVPVVFGSVSVSVCVCVCVCVCIVS